VDQWDASTWAQVIIAAVGLVVAIAATVVAWLTYRFTIDSQPVDFAFARSSRKTPPGRILMTIECRSRRAFLQQVWSPDWDGGDAASAPEVRMFSAKGSDNMDAPRSALTQGDVRMMTVDVPEGVTSFRLVATASVDKRGRARNVWSDRFVVPAASMEDVVATR